MLDIKIIENTEIAKEEYGHMWGSGTMFLTAEHLDALYEGKCIAWNDMEYVTFLILDSKQNLKSPVAIYKYLKQVEKIENQIGDLKKCIKTLEDNSGSKEGIRLFTEHLNIARKHLGELYNTKVREVVK